VGWSPLHLDELVEHWTELEDERALVAGKRGATRLGLRTGTSGRAPQDSPDMNPYPEHVSRRRPLTDSLVVGETVWAVDDDGTERLAWVSAERGETYVLRVYPASDGEKVGEVSFVVHGVDANLQPLRFE